MKKKQQPIEDVSCGNYFLFPELNPPTESLCRRKCAFARPNHSVPLRIDPHTFKWCHLCLQQKCESACCHILYMHMLQSRTHRFSFAFCVVAPFVLLRYSFILVLLFLIPFVLSCEWTLGLSLYIKDGCSFHVWKLKQSWKLRSFQWPLGGNCLSCKKSLRKQPPQLELWPQ